MTDEILTEETKTVDPLLEAQWDEWLAHNDLSKMECLSDDELKAKLISELSEVSQMTVGEYTLYQKWCEFQREYPSHDVSTLFGIERQLINIDDEQYIKTIKNNIWRPETVEDYMKLEPVLVYTGKNAELSRAWNTIRTFTSTMKNSSNIGRNLNYLVQDNVTGKYLGVICVSSDYLDLTPRDQFIGWSREKKTQGHMINFTAVGSTLVPLQPLGYNAVGGKLMALLSISDEVQNRWKELYGDTLIGVSTTSLYGKDKLGGLSQYDNLKHWKKMGYSAGSISYEVTKDVEKLLIDWLKKNYTRKYFEWYIAKNPSGQPYKRDHRNRSRVFAYSKLSVPKDVVSTAHQRGIYFSLLYENGCDFLRGDIKESELKKSFDTSYEYLTKLWKEKYAAKRLRSLVEQNRMSNETLFYDDLSYISWEETKERYLNQVGR
jgi:hypothetical protein